LAFDSSTVVPLRAASSMDTSRPFTRGMYATAAIGPDHSSHWACSMFKLYTKIRLSVGCECWQQQLTSVLCMCMPNEDSANDMHSKEMRSLLLMKQHEKRSSLCKQHVQRVTSPQDWCMHKNIRIIMMLAVHSKATQRWSVINGHLGKYTYNIHITQYT